MLFSCKITNSVLVYLDRHGEDVTALLEGAALSEGFLKDTSYWMQAPDMENFLSLATRLRLRNSEDNLLQKIGHATPDLRSWGVFDSVLRMMSLQDVLAQPSRFLSYFISPEPPVDNLRRLEGGIELDVPVPSDQFPLTTAYLKASFETLPVFSGKPQAQCSWNGMRLRIEWESRQSNIFNETDLGHHISPELMRSIVDQLEKHQFELQQKNVELEARNNELHKAYENLELDLRKKKAPSSVTPAAELPIHSYDFISESSLEVLRNQVSRLGDYMVRSQQLITLLVGKNQLHPSVKEAMRRVDWEQVKQEYPLTMTTCFEILKETSQRHKGEKDV